ncbi:MAG: SDR family oxidoreductase [Chromatiales bacterium]|nr:SDR family oxidoreductase [Chromatiales bacterium]
MAGRLSGHTALVTGAQQGIGAAVVRTFAREGANVVVNWLDDEAAAQALAAEARKAGVSATLVRGDVARPDDVARMVDAAPDVDLLVNNAGIFPRVAFLDMTDDDWDLVQGVNLRGSFLCLRAFARRLSAAGRPGAVVNLASIVAYRGAELGAHYVASKAGVLGLTRACALELAPHRIRVNAIAPGLVDTAQPRYGMSEEALMAAGRQMPLGRIVDPDEIADAALFLASDEARQITGQVLHVNGGSYLG